MHLLQAGIDMGSLFSLVTKASRRHTSMSRQISRSRNGHWNWNVSHQRIPRSADIGPMMNSWPSSPRFNIPSSTR
jgi:hypothetical protein